jgi:hypothetical protein
MRHGRKIIFVAVLVLSALIYFSPDESHRPEQLSEASEAARYVAYVLFLGRPDGLLRMSEEPAATKITALTTKLKGAPFEPFCPTCVYDQVKHLGLDLTGPVLAEMGDLQLVALDRLSSFVVMTFALRDISGGIVEIPGSKKILFAVALRYVMRWDDSFLGKVTRKIANLPILNAIDPIARHGTRGYWMLIDFRMNHRASEYYSWLVSHGEEEYKRRQAEWERLKKEVQEGLPDPEEYQRKAQTSLSATDRGLNFLYDWSEAIAEGQFRAIDRGYEKLKKAEQNEG